MMLPAPALQQDLSARLSFLVLQSFGLYDLHPSFPNFHSFWYSIVLVFQVLTLENWVPVRLGCAPGVAQ